MYYIENYIFPGNAKDQRGL